MYSDSDDSDVGIQFSAAPVVAAPGSAAATATAGGFPACADSGNGTSAASVPVSMSSPTNAFSPTAKTGSTFADKCATNACEPDTCEDTNLSERILAKCAVLIDASMLGSADIHPSRSGIPVEVAYRIITNPLDAEACRYGHQSVHLWEPDVNAGNMQRKEKGILINDITHRVKNLHGVPNYFHGVGDNNTVVGQIDTLKAYFEEIRLSDRVVENETIRMSKVESRERRAAVRTAMKTWVEAMCVQATTWCRSQRVEEVMAFLTLRGTSAEEVRRALSFFQLELGVKLPRYRVFTVEDVFYGPEAAPEDLERFSDADRTWTSHACPYHKHVSVQQHGHRYRCCYWTIGFMTRMLTDAAELLERHAAEEEAGPVYAGHAFEEDE